MGAFLVETILEEKSEQRLRHEWMMTTRFAEQLATQIKPAWSGEFVSEKDVQFHREQSAKAVWAQAAELTKVMFENKPEDV